MLINFAYEGLASIECDCLEFDGHGVQNLIDVNKNIRVKGFVADRFLKPPAVIKLQFKCDVDISRIDVKPRVGGQKSSGFEVLKVFRNQSAICIAKTVVKGDPQVVTFCRASDCGTSEAVKFCSERAADRVREIRLRIFRTAGSTVPALGAVDVWGTPSPNVPKNIKNEVISTWKSITEPKIDHPKIAEQSSNSSLAASVNPEVDVPPEFIDCISCEIMNIPMTLPSGNIVDASTLEKFDAAQAKLGRPIGVDPFTGVLFTDKSRPVFASALKSRLDKFLLENSDAPSIKTLPRALGRKSFYSESPPSQSSVSAFSGKKSAGCERSNILTVDDLLVDCLDGLPSYVDASVPQPKRGRPGCAKCSKPASPGVSDYFYKLSCRELVCRECLCSMRKLGDNQCPECGGQFDFSTVARHHL